MGTDGRHRCPVCSEPYEEQPAECFRCETPLRGWWSFEDAARSVRPPAPEPAKRRRTPVVPLLLAAILGASTAAVTRGIWSPLPRAQPSASPVAAPPPVGRPSPAVPSAPTAPSVLVYRVQPGDTLWRIAAALGGDGRNWRSLWPARDGTHPLAVGTVLEVPARPPVDSRDR